MSRGNRAFLRLTWAVNPSVLKLLVTIEHPLFLLQRRLTLSCESAPPRRTEAAPLTLTARLSTLDASGSLSVE